MSNHNSFSRIISSMSNTKKTKNRSMEYSSPLKMHNKKKEMSNQLSPSSVTQRKSELTLAKRPSSFTKSNNNRPLVDNINGYNTEKKKTFYNVISNFYLTRKFINLLKGLTSKRTPKYLTKYHFDLMNDRSFFYEEYLRKSSEFEKQKTMKSASISARIIMILNEKFKVISEECGVFDINKSFTMVWNAYVVVSMVFFFIYLPLFACFQDQEIQNSKVFIIARYFCFLVLILDVVKRLNTSFYKKGSLIENRREIARNYLKKHLLVDVLSLGCLMYQEFSIQFGFGGNVGSVIRFSTFLFFLKLKQFREIVKKFEEMLFIDEVVHNTLALLKLIFRILLLSHIFACMWYILGTTDYFRDTWLTHYNLADETLWVKYLYSYYYICVTMNTVGYGDFTPQNPFETLFAIIFIYVAGGVFSYSLNSIGIIVNDLTKRSKELSKELNVINEFMNEKNINFDLRMRVRNYLEYIFKEEKIEKVEEQGQIIKKLSDSIKEELLIEAHGSVIRDVKLFSLNFSEDTLRKTVLIMKEIRYTPGDIIFNQNDYNNKDLYLIRKGMVELFIENESHQGNSDISVIKHLKERDMFGEKTFFTNRERSVSARSCDFTTVYVINQEEFLSILKKSAKDFEKYCEIKDNINLYRDFSDLFIKCESCYKNTHLIQTCPILHYIPAEDIIIHRHTYNPIQERSKKSRNPNRLKINTLSKLDRIEKKAFQFQSEHLTRRNSEDEEERDSDDEGTTFKSLSNSQKSNINDNTEEDEDEMSEIKENEEEDEKALERPKSISANSQDNSRISFSRKKIQRRNTKKNGIVLLKKSSTGRTHSIDTNSFNIDSLDNFEVKFNGNPDENSLASSRSSQKVISLQSLFMKLFEQLKMGTNGKIQELKTSDKLVSQEEIKDSKSDNVIVERCFEIDAIKCYEDYYQDSNVDLVLERVEQFRKRKAQNKMKRNKSVYNFLSNLEISPRKIKLERGDTTTIGTKPKLNNIMRRNFFKNARNLEKLIMEDKFDVEKFKAFYIKKYENKKKGGFLGRIWKWLMEKMEKRQKKVSLKKLKSGAKASIISKVNMLELK